MIDYSDANQAIRPEFAESHTRYWRRLSNAGGWFTAQQRIAIAQAVREAEFCTLCGERAEALSPQAIKGRHDCLRPVSNEANNATDTSNISNTSDTAAIDIEAVLSAEVIEAIHTIARDASRITRSWYQGLLDKGMTEGEYVEVVGTVVSMISIDSFADAIGVAHRPLPLVASKDAATHYIPATAVETDQAWVPMVPADNAGTPEADLWPSGRTGNVVRAMSLVPDEVRTLCDLSDAHYLAMPLVRQPGVDAGRSLNRSQMELVAGRVSALNACYY